jgi:hypothetical protein
VTTKADFTPEEWLRLERAPLVAGMAIAVADPSGPIEEYKELGATTKTVLEAAGGGRSELVDAVAKDVAELAKQRQDPLQEIEPQGPVTAEQVVDELKAVNQLLSDKASAEDAAAFRELLLTAAQRAAEVAKEGGFIGFHASRVSEGEQRMLDKLNEVLSPQAAA